MADNKLADLPIYKRLAARKKLIPELGFNLVAVDKFERNPEHELYLVSHHDSLGEARNARKTFQKRSKDPCYIYGQNHEE